MSLVEKLSDVRDFRKILETTVKEIGENYSADVSQIVLSNPLDSNFTSICEYIANPEDLQEDLPCSTFPVHLEGGGLGLLSLSRQNLLTQKEVNEIRLTLADIADILRYAQINDIVQRDTFRSAFMSEITNLMSLPMGLGDALFMVVNILGKALTCSRCIFICVDDSQTDWKSYEYWQRDRVEAAQEYGWPAKDSAIVSQTLLSASPIISSEGQQNSYRTPVQEEMEFIGVRSQLSVAIRSSIAVHGAIILQQCESRHAWTRDEIDIVQSVADTVAEALAQLPDEKKIQEPIMRLYQHDVAETKSEGTKNLQDVRKALKGALGHTSIKKAQKSKQAATESTEPAVKKTQLEINLKTQIQAAAESWESEAGSSGFNIEESSQIDSMASGPQWQSEESGSFSSELAESPESTSEAEATAWAATQEETQGWQAETESDPVWPASEPGTELEGGWTQTAESGWPSQGTEQSPGGESELGGLANMLELEAESSNETTAPEDKSGEQKFKGVLGGLLGNQRAKASSMNWGLESGPELLPPPPPPPQALPQADSWELESTPAAESTPNSEAAENAGLSQTGPLALEEPSSAGKWGNLDAIPTPGSGAAAFNALASQSGPVASTPRGMVPGEKPAAGWGNLDEIGSPAAKPASKWGNLDEIPGPGAKPAQAAAQTAGEPADMSTLDAIPTPQAVSRGGLGAMMMGKAKASAVAGGSGLGQSLAKGGVKPPAPPNFVDGPPIQIDEAAAEAKLKEILASSNPTSDYIFATPGLDMRLLGRIDGWVSQVEAKDKHLNGHARAVAEYSQAVARLLGLSPEEVNSIRLAAIVHDIGKLGLAQQILQKPDEELSDAELVMTMNHPINGAKLIEGIPELAALAPIVLAHHEEYNGQGYPEGLSGEDIPLAARIIYACNSYAEMVSDLVYRTALSPEQAQNEMIRGAGNSYDPDVVQALVSCISQGIVPARFN
ncbi:MAG: HD domain-containing protein [Candidatus Obscuribacterales bacterium]|nr:HD domain-containing protein [Candidatus Obscuribacterales bacterium]